MYNFSEIAHEAKRVLRKAQRCRTLRFFGLNQKYSPSMSAFLI